jgi:predicted metal-dependent enzyme (double-stranded beta helix superfamily)
MQNILNAQSLSVTATLAPVPGLEGQETSLLQQFLPDTPAQISQACSGPTDLIAYRVRQALNEGLTPQATQQLLTVIDARPVSEQTYTRHILHADPAGRFTVVALVWAEQHSSPVHAHHTWCAYRVVTGELTESHFEWDAMQQKAYLFNKVKRQAGQSVCGNAGLELIHRLGNEGVQRAVSIHAYGVDADSISTHVNHVVPWAEKM